MKKKEKTELTIQEIADSALEMFGEKGYEGFFINEFCRKYNFSKGKVYHHFSGKDEIYIETVKCCFLKIISYLKESGEITDIKGYMKTRMNFFSLYPSYEKLFFEVMTKPPAKLENELMEMKKKLWNFNKKLISGIISRNRLKKGIDAANILEYFEIMQEVFNRHFMLTARDTEDLETLYRLHSEKSESFINYILYGIIEN